MTRKPVEPDEATQPTPSSGEGAASALRAMIRKRPPPPAFGNSELPGQGDLPPEPK